MRPAWLNTVSLAAWLAVSACAPSQAQPPPTAAAAPGGPAPAGTPPPDSPPCYTPTPPPTPATAPPGPPCLTPVPALAQESQVLLFEADARSIYPGDTLTLSWETTGTLVTICQRGTIYGDQCWQGLPPGGTYSVTTDEELAEVAIFDLLAIPSSTVVTLDDHSARLAIPVLCPHTWFFANPPADACPLAPASVGPGLAQTFEHGLMLEVLATKQIVILYDGGSVGGGFDTWTPDLPESDPALVPPDDFYQPVRGLGLLWRTGTDPRHFPPPRDQLGWATAPEFSIQTDYQCDWSIYAPQGTSSNCWLLGPDGQVIVLWNDPDEDRYGWEVWSGP